jgi:TPR repeat protein
VLYAYGLGVKRDEEAARRWYERAIAQKYLPAQDNLKALEESIKAGKPRTIPQRRQPGLQMVDLIILAGIIGLIMTSGMQPGGPYNGSFTEDPVARGYKQHPERIRRGL